MDTTQCITDGQWRSYAEKTLSEAQLLSVQQHVESCELCADIKEGIDSMAHPETLGETVDLINAEVDEYLKPKKQRGIIWMYWSAAAVFLIGIGISWWIAGRQPDTVVQQMGPAGKVDTGNAIFPEISETENPAIAQKEAETKAPLAQKDADKTSSAAGGDDKSTATQPATEERQRDDLLYRKDMENPGSALEKETVASGIQDGYDSGFLFRSTEGLNRVVTDNKVLEGVETTAKKYKRESLPSAAFNNNITNNSYNINNNSYDFSSSTFIEYLATDSINYYTAEKHFGKKQYDSCLELIEGIYNTNTDYYENGLLLKAKALLAQGNKEEAKETLNSVISLNRKKRKEATTLLKTIK